MAITEITIQNFKGIGEQVTVPLRPITLLFGANSAGKSTVLQALLYLRELLEHGNADADRLSASGSAIDLGGFQKFVHGHDLKRAVQIGVTVSVDDDGLPVYPVAGDAGGVALPLLGIRTAKVVVALEWDDQLERPDISSYSVFLNGEHAVEVEKTDVPDSTLRFIRMSDGNPIFKQISPYGEDDALGVSEIENLGRGTKCQAWGFLKYIEVHSVIPKFGTALPVLEEADLDGNELFKEPDARRLLSHVLVGAGELVLNELKRVRYIGPIRTVPDRNFSALRSPVEGRWADGSAAWDELHHADETPPWLNAEQIRELGLGYRIETYRYFECHRSLQNVPPAVESKCTTPGRWFSRLGGLLLARTGCLVLRRYAAAACCCSP